MESAADVGDDEKLPLEVQALIREGDLRATECAFAYDASDGTARKLGHIARRDYQELRPFEIPGTIDLLIRGNGRIVVVDYKGYEEVTDAESNAQTATYALMVARTYGYDEVTVAIVYLGGPRRPSIAVLGAFDLDAHAERLRQLQLDVARADAPIVSGPHCKYCNAFLACPLQRKLADDAGSGIVPMQVESMIPFESDEDAADAYDLFERIKMLSARLAAALHARASERQFRLHDGRVFGPHEKRGTLKIDADKAYEAIRAKYGQKIADASVQRKVAQKWIEDALAGAVPSPKKAKDALIKELEAAGGASREAKTVVEVYEPQKLLKVVNE